MRVLQEQVVGQESAVAAVSRAVTLALAGRCHANRPLAVLLFAGPFGSGKTHVAQSLAHTFLGNAGKLIYVNCQQLSEADDPLLNLHEQLASGYWYASASPPFWPAAFSIVVFEEIDKAPLTFRDHLAAAIDRGELQSRGCFFSLRNAFIILTIHLSKKKADQLIGRAIGFSGESETAIEMANHHIIALEETDNMLGTDLVSHIDEIVIFERLTERYILMLLDRRLAEIERFLAGMSIGFIFSTEAKSFLLKIGLEDLKYGMRQLNRGVRNYLEFPLADLILSGRLSPGTIVEVKYEPPRTFLHFQILIPQF
ncbi:MAG: AAA family ATPase [Acidobacteria bacterium]|nr:AAA family ATPase [Acidobacteriota bacterium]